MRNLFLVGSNFVFRPAFKFKHHRGGLAQLKGMQVRFLPLCTYTRVFESIIIQNHRWDFVTQTFFRG